MSEKATCRCREPVVDTARPRLCYECGLPVAATVPCPECGGEGKRCNAAWDGPWYTCPRCKGAGRVPARHSDAALDAIVDKVRRA